MSESVLWRPVRLVALALLAGVSLGAIAVAPVAVAGARASALTPPRRQQPSSPQRQPRRAGNGAPPQSEAAPAPRPSPAPASTAERQDQGDEVVRVETDLAGVLMTALDRNNRFVTTLRKEDLRVTENGVAQEVKAFQRETDRPLSVALLIDASRSQERTLPDEKRAARDFVASVLRPGKDNAAVVSFTGEPRVESPLTTSLGALGGAVERVRVELPPDNPTCDDDVESAVPVDEDPRCWTAVWESVHYTAGEVLARTPEQTRRAIILLSDGDDTANRMKRRQAADFALRHNVTVYSVGIGDRELYDIDEGALRKIAEQTGGRAFFPRTREELFAAFKEIEQELRSQYFIAYTPTNRARDNTFRAVRVEIVNPELRKQKLRLLHRQGYYARGN